MIPRLLITLAQLPTLIKPPSVQLSMISDCHSMCITTSNSHYFWIYLIHQIVQWIYLELGLNYTLFLVLCQQYQPWNRFLNIFPVAQLAEPCFTPSIQLTLRINCQWMVCPTSYENCWILIEIRNKHWWGGSVDFLSDSQLTFKAPSPRKHIMITGKYDGMKLTTT